MEPKKPAQVRLPQNIIEENAAPPHRDLITVGAVPRKQTPLGMPAAEPPLEDSEEDRQSHDDLEHVLEVEKLERERALLLAQLQDKEQSEKDLKRENALLRETSPTVVFPPPSIPPPASVPSKPPDEFELLKTNLDIEKIEKTLVKSGWARKATVVGVLLAMVWNAFNTYRARVPEKKVDGLQARVQQNEKASEEDIEARVLEKQRTLQALRALECWGRQTRGGFQRQGLDLPSLPAGGIKALKLGDEDPNRPGPPRFMAEEKCPDFPKLPPEGAAR